MSTKIFVSKIASFLTIFAMVFSMVGPMTAKAHTGGAGDHTFTAEVSPSNIELGDTQNFTFTVENTGGVDETPASWEIESFTIKVPVDFTVNISSLTVPTGWEVGFDGPTNEIRVSSNSSTTQIIPGESM